LPLDLVAVRHKACNGSQIARDEQYANLEDVEVEVKR
jgi:hypothetical protein